MANSTMKSIKHSPGKNEIRKINAITYVNVAVAVIYHQNQYLLGFRDGSQHQGNRYEFVGGKIDGHETAKQALIREVAEETGIDIASNIAVKLGRLHHDYGDKQVCLLVYKVALSTQQYEAHKHRKQGLEGQALTWVDKSKLLAGDYNLPAANKTILEWLRLPAQIAITYPLAHFSDADHSATAWLQYHAAHLAQDTWVYVRPKATNKDTESNVKQLLRLRPDIHVIMPSALTEALTESLNSNEANEIAINCQIVASHLTQTQLMQWSDSHQGKDVSECNSALSYYSSYPLIISCHDAESIYAANKLAHARLEQQLSPIIGIFLSPVLVTKSHPETTPLGWQAWAELTALADMPVIGLGGLSPMMSVQAVQYGGVAVAGIRQFFQ
ncbi:8-oxo-dGTP diphosphatase [Psychrobacter luti]|uniref:8-oxo-dGTP diphosphatase n=1 Tax=Psychrobacter luti TaxID=198481 RepID=A0A839TDF1_9GAMM|nr:NUDIX domain-containing protein [Psychrobacter luti]MBB3107461.1 8-oxo-dGTP diphosphatase [Psychrobacter luti]